MRVPAYLTKGISRQKRLSYKKLSLLAILILKLLYCLENCKRFLLNFLNARIAIPAIEGEGEDLGKNHSHAERRLEPARFIAFVGAITV